jgi:hypothetical protein
LAFQGMAVKMTPNKRNTADRYAPADFFVEPVEKVHLYA